MENKFDNTDILSAFGLTQKQTSLMFSLQRVCINNDIHETDNKKQYKLKRDWVDRWGESISKSEDVSLIDPKDIEKEFKNELNNTNTHTWFNLIILETVTFSPYFPLGDTEEDKSIKRLHYHKQTDYVENFISTTGYGKPEIAELYFKMYDKAINKASGKTQKIIINTMIVLLVAALTAATAGALAGPIAVFAVGTQFSGLSGAALIAASLSFLGGGAVAAGGAGMAGGVLVVVGGGALLGAAAGGAAITGKEILFENSPQFALTFAAKLDVVLREIILNEQKDTKLAQAILENYKKNILEQKNQIAKLELENEKNKNQIKNLKKAVEYMENIFKDMNRFSSAYEDGLAQEKDNENKPN